MAHPQGKAGRCEQCWHSCWLGIGWGVWQGERVDLGRLSLKRYPIIKAQSGVRND